ncbi:MAG: diguanylate cyclase [Candidatus Omnitrophica bacterium]|nr:diguanylate cyclase [Candidatus Omnitrophota bacterium]MCM8823195.1 diguanylate cyclase [Candidatus Omnitrophota bacterium]MCM8826519.1 diguanylate cyclase [Candidatus Omnitrophota bacterium]
MQEKESKSKILIIVEDPKLQDYLTLILMGEGYIVQVYSSEEELRKNINKESFDLLIVDFLSQNIDGLKICKLVRETLFLRYTSMITLLPDSDPLNKAKSIYSGADDYIEKSIISQELLFKVKAALWRIYRYQDIDPLTKLPSISTALKELQNKINSRASFAVGYAELFEFQRFNERYGFKRGDEVIIHTANLIRQAIVELGSPSDFLFHFGGDDFIFITLPESIDTICKKIVSDFDDTIISFYDENDRRNKCIYIKNRRGEICRYPLMKISIGIVSSVNYPLTSPAQIIQIVTELKDYAKKFEKSEYVKERRKIFPFHQ